MADAAVATLVKEMVRILGSVANQELALLRGLEGDISSLKNDFEQIQAVLQDAEEKQVKNNTVKVWLKHLRSVSLEAENVLDEISTEALLQSLYKKRIKYRVKAFFSPNQNKFMSRLRIAHKVKDIRKKLDDIAFKRFELGLIPSDAISDVDDMVVENEMPNRETSSLIHDSSIIFGRDEEMEMVTKEICDQDVGKCDNGEVPVYSIWGMGGLGKTTLAQLVYNHERVKQCFELKCWIYVSEKFQVKEIMKKIIESIDDCGCTLTLLDKLQESLQRKLEGKKFLVVLDDVWVEDDENEKNMWEELRKTLRCGAEGSIVVMTTRSQVTSRMCSKIPELQHHLGCLSEEDAWLLFKKLAFAPGREGDNISELEPIGRKIVEKCRGLPIEVKTLGSLLWSKSNTSDWLHVKDNNIWELQENEVLPALKLSYDNLHPHAKRCFTYCCLFPKGYAMQKDVVIQLWLSNYFIPPRREKNVYLLGKNIFNHLVQRFFFEVVKDDKYLDDRYKMHDLMHDMAQHLMKDDCLFSKPSQVRIPNEVLHLSSTGPDFLFSLHELKKLKSLRSIFMFGKMNEGNNINQIFNHKYVRVLYLCGIGLTTLPESIRNLIHLKYLNLSESRIEVLPESIVYLQNLQVLLLYSCRELYKLPDDLRYMCNLECLDISYCHSLSHLPLGIKQLSRLRILSKFPLGNEGGAKIEELGDLNLLEGKLKISGLENVGGLSEARSAKLECKENLLVLGLRWSDIYKRESKPEMFANDEEVLKGLEPNPCLKELNVFCYMGKIIPPSWMAKLLNLVEIRFYSCRRCDHIPQLGRLPKLRVIRLWSMDSLKDFHGDDENMLEDTIMFPCLRELRIYLCPNLVSLPSNLPNLEVLRLVKCDKLPSLPDKIQSSKKMNNLVILGCKLLNKRFEETNGEDWAKISHIPNIRTRSPRYKQDEDESSW